MLVRNPIGCSQVFITFNTSEEPHRQHPNCLHYTLVKNAIGCGKIPDIMYFLAVNYIQSCSSQFIRVTSSSLQLKPTGYSKVHWITYAGEHGDHPSNGLAVE